MTCILKSNSWCDVVRNGFGKWLSHKKDSLINGIRAGTKESPGEMKTIWLLHLSSHCLPSLIWLICLDKTGVLFLLPHPLYVCTPPQTVHLWKGSILKQTGLFFNQCQTDNCKPTQETPKSVLMPQSENRRKTHRCTCLAERKPLSDIKLPTSLL